MTYEVKSFLVKLMLYSMHRMSPTISYWSKSVGFGASPNQESKHIKVSKYFSMKTCSSKVQKMTYVVKSLLVKLMLYSMHRMSPTISYWSKSVGFGAS